MKAITYAQGALATPENKLALFDWLLGLSKEVGTENVHLRLFPVLEEADGRYILRVRVYEK